MRRVIEDTDVRNGFDSMLGEKIVVFCTIYIYTGKLVGVNDDHIELDDAKIVYETGVLAEGEWKDAQCLLNPWKVMRGAIESWGPAKC